VSRTGLELVPASAGHSDFFVGGVDSGFHNSDVLGNSSLPYSSKPLPQVAALNTKRAVSPERQKAPNGGESSPDPGLFGYFQTRFRVRGPVHKSSGLVTERNLNS
jgi:hypothetical protein